MTSRIWINLCLFVTLLLGCNEGRATRTPAISTETTASATARQAPAPSTPPAASSTPGPLPAPIEAASSSGTNQRGPGAPYKPITSLPPQAIPYAKDSLGFDFQRALKASTLDEAAARWTRVLQRHAPESGEYEDGFQARHIRAAQLELARVHYLRGEHELADRLLRDVLQQ